MKTSHHYHFVVPFIRLKQKANLVFLGLDEAGKTTLMGRLKYDTMIQANPTHQPRKSKPLLLQFVLFASGTDIKTQYLYGYFFRPFKIECVFCIRKFLKLNARTQKHNTSPRNLHELLW